MAHRRQSCYDGMLLVHGQASAGMSTFGDEELSSDVDEPPDSDIHFTRLMTPISRNSTSYTSHGYRSSSKFNGDKNESLLTQALLSSPELNPLSDAEAPVLNSDGELTSPALTSAPSPLLLHIHPNLTMRETNNNNSITTPHEEGPARVALTSDDNISEETTVEAGLGRKRCISFACGRQSNPQKSSERPMQPSVNAETPSKVVSSSKRPCMLRFACPMRPTRAEYPRLEKRQKSPSPLQHNTPAREVESINTTFKPTSSSPHDSKSPYGSIGIHGISSCPTTFQARRGKIFNRIDFQQSEATRFHEFAGHFNTDDEWMNEQTAYRHRITVNDTLRKENAIRKLAEEAEEEALEEEDEGVAPEDDNEDYNSADGDDGDGHTTSNDGNETDDEEGFADSDNESDGSLDYDFWTPDVTTAATSADHLEHVDTAAQGVGADFSLGSTQDYPAVSKRYHVRSPRMRSATPDLPDSSDFVIGTIDEDRPLEEAYLSCLEERRRSKRKLIPQDIDPSFPASEPEAEDDNDGNDGQEDTFSNDAPDSLEIEPKRVTEHPNIAQDCELVVARVPSVQNTGVKALIPSPKRMQSPPPKRFQSPPPKRPIAHRSPPPRHLFGQTSHHLRTPSLMRQKLTSPPSTRRSSIAGSQPTTPRGIAMPHLAQRPNPIHTTSLPRTSNPFWVQHHRSRFHISENSSASSSPKTLCKRHTDTHSRGPIDIVQGLETKRQRRKEKFWRQHCRGSGKEKERRCQPGKGAERMKELGLEMADRFRGYGQRVQLVLSI